MIESIEIKKVATYSDTPQMLTGLSKFNFIYGSNGSGKTTISRIIADESIHPTCSVKWSGGNKLQTMVYNRDFVANNFQSNELKGIFTLGQQDIETLKKITEEKELLDGIQKDIQKLKNTLHGEDGTSGKKGELATLEEEFKTTCWSKKQKLDSNFSGAFEGYRGSSEKFKQKIIQEFATNTATSQTLDYLVKKSSTVFGETPAIEQAVTTLEFENILAHESNSILSKRVIGKEDVDIAAMIKKLGSSDWVREGRTFFEVNNKTCPFCQQKTSDGFAKSLNEYFDDAFITDTKTIETLTRNYETDSARLQQVLQSIITNPSRFLDIEKLKIEKDLLDSKVTINIQKLASKKKEPSQIVELDSLANVLNSIGELINAANAQVAEHNVMVANLSTEQKTLTSQVWKYILESELKTEITAYNAKKDGLSKAIAGIAASINTKEEERKTKAVEIRTLEKDTTSIQPTIDGINALLASFGFQGFSIAKAATGNFYKLIRTDGSNAQETLSEGEKTFITFLYFYHLLKGSVSESGITTDRIVVFDDPVSSLDSDILFIVGGLIKGLFEEVRNGIGHIKQVFVLTHNVYFHKEVTFNPKRQDVAMTEESFTVVRKSDLESKIEMHNSNPIKTSYELLWSEIRRSDRSKLTIQNTMRRILENYFKILGGVDSDKICAMFEGKDKLICKSLFSWINDGSHFASDDLFVAIDDGMIDTYLKVFREIFVKSEHLAHYKMMMGASYVEPPLETIAA